MKYSHGTLMPLTAKPTSLFLFFMLLSIEAMADGLKNYNIDVGPINGVSTEALRFSFKERTYGNGQSVKTLMEKSEVLLPEEEFLLKRDRAVFNGIR